MAEQLGTAVLDLEVNLAPLTKGLEQAKRLVQSASLELNVRTDKADTQFRRIEASVKTLQTQLRTLNATPLNLNTAALNKLGDEAVAAGRQINDFARSVINGNTALANNIVGLQQQGRAFSTLAANVKVGTAEFRNFTQAAAQANQKQLFAGFEEIKSLESLFRVGGSGGLSSFKGTEDLLAFSRQIGSTPAAINLYIRALEQARSVTKVTDTNFAKLTTEINRQIQALTQATAAAENYGKALGSRQLALPAGKGPGQFVFEGPSASDLAAEERRRRRAQKISERIDYFSTGGVSPQDPGLVTRPNAEAIAAEQRLSKARRDAARTAQSLAAAENKQAQQRKKASRERLTGALSNAIIGGAFPLLFGQGIGAAAGGATGGAAGGLLGGQFGFGLSLVGTAVGTAFDTALQKGQDLARGLKDPIGNFDLLKQNALLSSKAVESQAEALIAAGREAEAYALIQRDLTSSYGDIAALEEYRVAVDELNREWTRVSIEAARFAAAPLTEFLERLRLIISGTPRTREEAQGKRETASDLSKAGLGIATAGGALSLTGVGVPLGLLGVGIGALLVAIGDSLAKDASKQVAEGLKQSDITTFWDTILKAGARSVVAGVVGFRDLETAANLQQTRTELGSIPGLGRNFRFLEFAEQEQKVAALLASLEPEKRAETLQKINKLREQEFKLVSDLQRLDTERSNALVNTERSLANSLQLLGTQRGAYRDTLGVVQGITASIIEAQQVRDLATQDVRTAALALDPNEPGADLARLQERQRTINTEFANVLVKGAFELQKASETARDNFRDAVLNLTKIRSDPAGLNRFLSPLAQQRRAEQDSFALLPLFRQAQQQFAELTGQRAPEFRGPREGVNEAIRDFINTVNAEREANLAVQNAKAAADLIKTNQDLLEANRQLAIATTELAQKQWLVDVNVVNQAGGASTVNAVTSLAS